MDFCLHPSYLLNTAYKYNISSVGQEFLTKSQHSGKKVNCNLLTVN